MRKFSRQMLKKSKSAFLLSLELFNKPTIEYRIEAFSILFTNAWELLLKAHLYEIHNGRRLSVFKQKKKNQQRESISLDDCLKKVFSNANNPIKRNIEFISKIRNESVHLIIIELEPYFSRVFQKGVEYYTGFLYDYFSVDINDEIKPGLVSMVTDINKVSDISVLKNKINKEDYNSIINTINEFQELDNLGATIPIDHTIAIVKNDRTADLTLSLNGKSKTGGKIIEKSKDRDVTHPYNRTKALKEIKDRIPSKIIFNQYDFEAYLFVTGTKKNNNDYHNKGKFSISQYSKKLIDEIIQTVWANPKILEKNRKQYREHLKRKQRKKG